MNRLECVLQNFLPLGATGFEAQLEIFTLSCRMSVINGSRKRSKVMA
jgi:hypothetical protein